MSLESFLSQRSGVALDPCLKCEALSEFDGSVMQLMLFVVQRSQGVFTNKDSTCQYFK